MTTLCLCDLVETHAERERRAARSAPAENAVAVDAPASGGSGRKLAGPVESASSPWQSSPRFATTPGYWDLR
jgi:hypothetical protein